MVSKKGAVIGAVLVIVAVGTSLGYGILSIPPAKFAFDLMMLLTFVWMLIWTIRKRHANEKNQRRE